MKVQTNQGECELTAEMVCRGMVFQDPKIGPYALVGYDHYAQAWITETKGTRTEAEVAIAHVFLGCDPAIASRADCERFGVHGDAAAHGFARLRGGGAVDLLREGEPRGSMFRCPGGGPPISPRCSMGRYEMVRQGQWIGLNAVEARPEDVERLCCGEYGPDQIDSGNRTTWVPRCTLAIGPHDDHEDLATGERWRDSAKEPAVKIGWYSPQMAEVSGTSIYRTPDGRTVGVTSVTDGEKHPMAWPDVRRVGPVAEFVRRGRPAATWTYLQDARPITLTTASGFRFDGGGDLWAHADAVDASSFAQAAMKGHVTFTIGSNQKPGEVAQAVVDKMLAERALEPATETRDCIAACPVGLDRAGWSGAVQALASYRQGNGSLAHMSLTRLVQIVAPALVRGAATEDDGKIHHLALSAYRKAATEARARDEASLVALVNACPEGLDPVGWRAAVLAYAEMFRSDANFYWFRKSDMPHVLAVIRDGERPAGMNIRVFADAYQRAIAPRSKVAPERKGMTWKTRGPALPVDDGRDDD